MKRGFTLIELLAVIVILAIIAVIAVPIVLNIIDESKNNATLRSAEFYVKAAELSIAQSTLKDKNITDGEYNLKDGDICLNDDCTDKLDVEVNGEVPTSGTITISNGKVAGLNIVLDNKTIVKNEKGELEYVGSSSDDSLTLSAAILKEHGGQSKIGEVSSFATNPQDGEYGLYKAEDDLGTSYYFRGDVVDNYVKFGEWQVDTEALAIGLDDNGVNQSGIISKYFCESVIGEAPWTKCEEFHVGKKGQPMYWRIVRINGDGTIRLIYDGTKAETNDSTDGNYIHYDVSSVTEYSIDQFYNDNLKTKYIKYMADSIFCSEKVVLSEDEYFYTFSNYERINNNLPKLTCTRDEDKLTVASGKLTNPIGYITADEALMGGSESGSNSYLYGYNYFTISPGYLHKENVTPSLLIVRNDSISFVDSEAYAERPVINLKADVKFKGTGKIDDPYVIVTE